MQAGAGSPHDLSLMLRAGKTSLRTSMFQEEIVTQVGCPVCKNVCCTSTIRPLDLQTIRPMD